MVNPACHGFWSVVEFKYVNNRFSVWMPLLEVHSESGQQKLSYRFCRSGANWLNPTTGSYRFIPQWKWTSAIIYVLLAISYLLIIILFGLMASQGRSKWQQHLENVYPCGDKSREWKYFDGACYLFSFTQAIWHTAKNKCEEKNSELVVITNQYEQNFLQAETRGQRFWIGLSDHNTEGEWRWVDSTDYRTSFKNWLEGEPNDHSNNEDCGELGEAGKWNDIACNTKKFYVCKKPLSPWGEKI